MGSREMSRHGVGLSRNPQEVTMKRLFIAGIWLVGGLALADSGDEKQGVVEMVQVRLSEIENIDVSAEKIPVEATESLDSEIESILDEASALEAEQAEK